ncbi:hypothetical protein DAI22_12g122300 [Oryza sativa Japonica Group]|nr:hypothetical protein DAI22_12g122300 [Oryza sativa Japonica Group]
MHGNTDNAALLMGFLGTAPAPTVVGIHGGHSPETNAIHDEGLPDREPKK